MLKSRIDELASKIENMEKRLNEATTTNDKLNDQLKKSKEELESSTKKYERAEKIAAHLEKQFKVFFYFFL
jgi:septal ring factor EnvC (AmiA/AmiB activator)